MASLTAISETANDEDLRRRMVSAAAELGIPVPESWVANHALQLAAARTSDSGTETIADTYSYAKDTRPPPPGLNPGAVNDTAIRYAVQTVFNTV